MFVHSDALEKLRDHLRGDDSTLALRQENREALISDLSKMLEVLSGIEGSSCLILKTERLIEYVGGWNPNFPRDGKLTNRFREYINELGAVRIEKVESGLRVKQSGLMQKIISSFYNL
jgi:hypothetical protein